MLSRRSITILVLLAINMLAIRTMVIQMLENGLHARMTLLRDFGPHLLPGSSIPLKKTYVGFQSVDYVLTVLQCVFANVVDGSSPGLSLFAFYFSGTFLAAIIAVWADALKRRRSTWFQIIPASWCLAMQAGYGVVMPVYCITSLLLTPKAHAESMSSVSSNAGLPDIETSSLWISICLGYILPSTLMCWKTENYELHQSLVAFWQVFPAWILVSQLILSRLPRNVQPFNSHYTRQQALERVFQYGKHTAASIHITALGTVALAYFVPSLFDSMTANALQPQNVFIPPRFWTPDPVDSIAQGVHIVFQWDHYLGTAAMLIWLWLLNVEACEMAAIEQPGVLALIIKTIMLGPGAVAITLLAQKDRISQIAVEVGCPPKKRTTSMIASTS